MKSEKCNKHAPVKYGKSKNGTQRFKCTLCAAIYTENSNGDIDSTKKLRIALHLLLVGYSVIEIAETIKAEESLIAKWQEKHLPKVKDISLVNRRPPSIDRVYMVFSALEKGRLSKILIASPEQIKASRSKPKGGPNP